PLAAVHRTSVACPPTTGIRTHAVFRMFTTVASYLDPVEAQIARGLLAAEGIDAHVGDEHLAIANWEWRLAIGGTRVRVADADAAGAHGALPAWAGRRGIGAPRVRVADADRARARATLQAMEAGEYAIDDGAAPADAQLRAPDRESPSSRLAWLALILLNIPLP